MQLRVSREIDRCRVGEEIPPLLRTSKVDCSLHNSPLLNRIVSQFSLLYLVLILKMYYFKIHPSTPTLLVSKEMYQLDTNNFTMILFS